MALDYSSIHIVIAIDFGTSRSGYAYAFTNEKRIYSRTEWPRQPEAYPKTLTQLLYSPDKKVIAWGFDARYKLAEVRNEHNFRDYDFFSQFKMRIHKSESRTRSQEPTIIGKSGASFLLQDLVSDYLRLMKSAALEEISKNVKGFLRSNEILWCLTVPAIWNDADKQLMRQAAQNAGLIDIDSADQERLLLVLEPEAASLYCKEKKSFALTRGSRIMVVDCGGGTVDITAHEVLDNGDLKELAPGDGGGYGSMYVDQEFTKFLKERLTSEVIDSFTKQQPIEYLQLMDEWERVKCRFDPNTNNELIYFPIPATLYKILTKQYRDVHAKLMADQNGDDENLHMTRHVMQMLFTPILNGIIHKVNEQFRKLPEQRCDYIFLVGGFANSPILQKSIEKEFQGRVKEIYVPPMPGAAIVEGAVFYGLNPSSIRERQIRFTYGCLVNRPFIAGDDERKKYLHEERKTYYCRDTFNVFVREGDSVEFDEKVTQSFSTPSSKSTIISVVFFSTKNRNPLYTDEIGTQRLGEILIETPDLTGGLNRTVQVTMYFGRTEIKVEAKDKNTGKEFETKLKYLYNDPSSLERVMDLTKESKRRF